MYPEDKLLNGRIERAAVAALRESMAAPMRVVFLAGLHVDSREAFKSACRASEANPLVSRVSRKNGDEHIEMIHGGRIDFIAASAHGGRRISVGVLFVAEHLMHMEDIRSEILLMTATGGRIITF